MTKPKDFRVLLVRSGRNDWDVTGRVTGSSDLPLCDRGRADAHELGSVLGDERLSVVLSGPDEASVQTAQILAGMGKPKAKVRVLDDLAEVDLGLWEGLLSEDLVDRYPKAYKAWTVDPSAVDVPEGERFDKARARVLDQLGRGLLRLAVKAEHPAVGVVVRPLMYGIVRSRLLDMDTKDIWRLAKDPVGAEWHRIDTARAEGLLRRAMAGR